MPVPETTVLTTPLAWDTPNGESRSTNELTAEAFWAGFGSPQLLGLQKEAARANPDLMIAIDHLQIARNAEQMVRARQRPSMNFHAGPVDTTAITLEHPGESRRAAFALELSASYELDFWNRLGSLTSSAQAEAQAQRYDAETARISLMCQIAQRYFDLSQADEADLILQHRSALAQERLDLQEARLKAGRIDEQTLAQAQAGHGKPSFRTG